jgi:hypothetical protein
LLHAGNAFVVAAFACDLFAPLNPPPETTGEGEEDRDEDGRDHPLRIVGSEPEDDWCLT